MNERKGVHKIMAYNTLTERESCFDPTFALVAILEWAGIVRNGWGYIELTEEYVRERIQKEG